MKMTPHPLGFDVPEQGIEVNEHDDFYILSRALAWQYYLYRMYRQFRASYTA